MGAVVRATVRELWDPCGHASAAVMSWAVLRPHSLVAQAVLEVFTLCALGGSLSNSISLAYLQTAAHIAQLCLRPRMRVLCQAALATLGQRPPRTPPWA